MQIKRYVIARSQLPTELPSWSLIVTWLVLQEMKRWVLDMFHFELPGWVTAAVMVFLGFVWLTAYLAGREEVEVEMELTPFNRALGDQPGPGMSGRIVGGTQSGDPGHGGTRSC